MRQAAAPLVEVTDLEVAYGETAPVLKDLSFTIEEGEVVGITGATGCGKTTLLYTLCGVIPHYVDAETAGDIRVFGDAVSKDSLPRLLKDIGFLFQDPESQLFNLLVRDELVWGLENRGYGKQEMERRLHDTLAFLHLEDFPGRITYDLSGGEKQRVALGCAYIMEPRLFLLDDPTSQLDPVGSAEVISGIRALADRGSTIVLVEQKLDELLTTVDRLVVLADGGILFDGPVAAVLEQPDVFTRAGMLPPEMLELRSWLVEHDFSAPPSLSVSEWAAHPAPVPPSQTQARAAPAAEAADPSALALSARELLFRYPPPRDVPVLKNVDVALPRGRVVGILGKNGSGKTTLARCLSGHLTPTAGVIDIAGRVVHEMPLHERVLEIGYVFQNPRHQVFRDPVFDDVAFGPRNLGWPQEQVEQRATEVLAKLGLAARADLHPYELSKGQLQRLAIAGVLVMDPRILLIDEPTTGQDPAQAVQLCEELVAWARSHDHTLILITHAMELVARFVEWAIVMQEGRVAFTGPPQELFGRDPDELAAMSLQAPPVARLTRAWAWSPPALTVEEATGRISAQSPQRGWSA